MPTTVVNGLKIAYELHGEGEPIAITPGGRYSMDALGVRELAQSLAARGKQVLIWDRPNTGGSDITFDAEFESNLHADTLAGLIRTLGLGKTTIVGGSAGSRVSLLTAVRHPDVTERLAVWWVSGGFFGLLTLAAHYCGENWTAAVRGGMNEVVQLPGWQETFAKNPANRDRLLAMDPAVFAAKMEQWGPTFLQVPGSPVPGLSAADFASISVPTLVFRSGPTDPSHPREVSEQVHHLIPGSKLVEPPWGEQEWNRRSAETRSTGNNVLFGGWPLLADQLKEFAES
ncbi:alpha/beta fold hydrolase [Rhodococcoides yunnanense]|uniref:alpha/beta fold hydrolase n=1 Tax=Rhodococcoides yunnanense TaxID=278209 RepID=UPI00093276BC|nr:alpha/beta hydrolase [Rhodococcus yunnanensis]